MTVVKDILTYLNTLAPPAMKEDWDRVGLNCGRMDRPVQRVLVALDPFFHVCEEAAAWDAQLLVTHHALLWTPGFVTDQDQQGRCALFLMEHGIAHINAHTNLDCAPGGVNDVLARTLGLEDIQVLDPGGVDAEGRPWGLLRAGKVPSMPVDAFLRRVKQSLHCPGLRYVDGGRPVHRVAVGGGNCSGELQTVLRAGCDTFVTADTRYNQFWDAADLGITMIDAGHFYTENPVCAMLAHKISRKFPEISVKVSEKHTDCMKFF